MAANDIKDNLIGGKYMMGQKFGGGAFGEIYMGKSLSLFCLS